MELYELLDIEDCPICGGGALLEEDGNCFSITCLDCGAYTMSIDFKSEEEKLEVAKTVTKLWNSGKVLKGTPGE